MEITTKELRMQPGRIISQVTNGQEFTITFRGKALARLVPFIDSRNEKVNEDSSDLFGMWKDRKDIDNIDTYIRNIRQGRVF